MDRRRFLYGLGGVSTLAMPGLAQSTTGKGAADIDVVQAAMQIHPGRDRYLTPAAYEAQFTTFVQTYLKATSEGAVQRQYLALSRFLTALRCGHSYPNFFNQTEAPVKALFDHRSRLPFDFEWIGNTMVITKDYSGTGQLPIGTRVTSINARSSAQMLAALMPYTRADGHNDAKRRSLLGVRGAEDIEYFDVFQGLLLPPRGATHQVEIVRPDGVVRHMALPVMTFAERQATMTRVREDSDQPRWTFTLRPDNIAVLDMPGWAMWNSKWDWRSWLSDRLDAAATAKGLIVDIRQNEGGDDCGDPILARLADHDLKGWNFEGRVRFREVSATLAPHVSTWDDRYKSVGVGATDLGNSWYRLNDDDVSQPVRPDKKRLNIPVAALIGPANSSATFAFINASRVSGKVKLIGEPTGGNRRGINGGGFFFTKLPESGIEFDLPLIGYFPPTPQPDAGIAPDILAPMTVKAMVTGADPAMEAAVAWIKQR